MDFQSLGADKTKDLEYMPRLVTSEVSQPSMEGELEAATLVHVCFSYDFRKYFVNVNIL